MRNILFEKWVKGGRHALEHLQLVMDELPFPLPPPPVAEPQSWDYNIPRASSTVYKADERAWRYHSDHIRKQR
jgi:hypothetical protein